MLYSILFSILINSQLNNNAIPLQQAMEKKLVEVTVTNNPAGTHYLEPITLEIKSNTTGPIDVLVENGQSFAPGDSDLQPIVIIQELMVNLQPFEHKKINLNGLCFDADKGAPWGKEVVYYTVKDKVSGKLLELTNHLQNKGIEGYTAQHAVWAISNNHSAADIVGWNESSSFELAKYVANLTGQPEPQKPEESDYERNLRSTPSVEIGGNFTYTLLKETEIHIAMFDEDGIVVRELYYNENQAPGDYSFDYVFDATVYTDNVYYIRYLENKQIYMQFKMEDG